MTTAHTTPTPSGPRKPTPRQLRYLRDLATRCGESFAMPRTASDASREIDRLKTRKRTPSGEVRRERREISRDMATRSDAVQVRDDEITGYGSRATWNADRPSPRPDPPTRTPAKTVTDPPSELGRYTTSNDGERIVVAQRINGTVRLTDIPAVNCGRRIVIERDLTDRPEIDAIVTEYLAQAAALDRIPALTSAL